MIAEAVAAASAFNAIMSAVKNGRELSDVSGKVADYVNATEDLKRRGEKKRKSPFSSGTLQEFMELERLKQQEERLREVMIWSGRPGLWNDWQRYQAEARKARQREAQRKARLRSQIIEGIMLALVGLSLVAGVIALVWWIVFLKGMNG